MPLAAAPACADHGVGGDAARGRDAIGVAGVDESAANDAAASPVDADLSDLSGDDAVGNAGKVANDYQAGVGEPVEPSSLSPAPALGETLDPGANQPSTAGAGGSVGPTTSELSVPTTDRSARATELDQIVGQLEAEVAALEQELNQLG
ncbi:MAG: hypothetical protein N2037_03625 [Acidimicrobiales bacterium]|nr:hypothetical protein [Acidimicrobiales bacterium]